MEANGAHAVLRAGLFGTDVEQRSPAHTIGSASGQAIVPSVIDQGKREPNDRAAVGNGPFDEVEEIVVKECE